MTTAEPEVEAGTFAYDAPVHEPTMVDVVRSEWLKLRSVRSTYWTMAVVFVAMVGLGALICFALVATWDQLSPAEQQDNPVNGTSSSLDGLLFAQLAMVVLGVLAITSEYSTGGVRSTLVAVPRRGRIVVAKVVVVGLVTLVVGTIASFLAFFAGQAVLATKGFNDSLGDENVLRAVVGSGLYLAACALFGLGIGLCIRSSGGGITVAVAGLFVVPPLTLAIPGTWGDQIQKYVTSNAGWAVTDTASSVPSDQLGPWVGYLVFTVWWVALVALGAWLLKRRDV